MRFRAVSPGSASAPNSDLVTRTIHVADRELLERWMERQVLASDRVDVADLDEPNPARGHVELSGRAQREGALRAPLSRPRRSARCVAAWASPGSSGLRVLD